MFYHSLSFAIRHLSLRDVIRGHLLAALASLLVIGYWLIIYFVQIRMFVIVRTIRNISSFVCSYNVRTSLIYLKFPF